MIIKDKYGRIIEEGHTVIHTSFPNQPLKVTKENIGSPLAYHSSVLEIIDPPKAKLNDFIVDSSWICPECGSIQRDTDHATDGAIEEFWCSDCETTFKLTEQIQYK